MMLADLEKKTASLIADSMSGRQHLSVMAAPGPPVPADDGLEVAVVSVVEASTGGEFRAERIFSRTSPPQSQRVLPLSVAAVVDFAIRPEAGAGGLAAARTLLLEDVSLVSHFLSGEGIRGGVDFIVAGPDPGFRVRSFRVVKHTINRGALQGLLTASIECAAEVEIWPPDQVSKEGKIDSVRHLIVAQPIEILPLQPVVAMGGILRLRVLGLPPVRRESPSEPLALSISVLSDVPPNQRGTIANGVPGAEAGSRVVTVTGPSTDVQYVAPTTGVSGMRVEFLAIHAATPEGRAGVFLGSVAVRVTGGN